MNRAMTQVVVKAQQVLRKEQAVLQLASKRDINDMLNLDLPRRMDRSHPRRSRISL